MCIAVYTDFRCEHKVFLRTNKCWDARLNDTECSIKGIENIPDGGDCPECSGKNLY